MKDALESKLKQIEKNLAIYNSYVNNMANSEDNRKVVSFKILYDMMSFTAIHSFIPEYKPSTDTMTMLSINLANTSGYVDIVDDKVVISPAYQQMLAQRNNYLKS